MTKAREAWRRIGTIYIFIVTVSSRRLPPSIASRGQVFCFSRKEREELVSRAGRHLPQYIRPKIPNRLYARFQLVTILWNSSVISAAGISYGGNWQDDTRDHVGSVIVDDDQCVSHSCIVSSSPETAATNG